MKFLDRFFGPPTEAKFAKLLIDALHRAGDDQQYVYEEAESRLNITKDRKNIGVINLRNFYTIFRGLPKQDHPEFLKKTCAGLVNRMEIPDDFEDVKADIRPTVRSRSMAELIRLGAEAEGTKYLEVPSIPLSEHLVACLVYDLPNAMQFVNQEKLDTWGVSLYEAMEVARQNLDEQNPASYAMIDDRLFIFQVGDAYDATRMLSLEMMRSLKVDGKPVALPITRDCLMITGSDDAKGQAMMVVLAEKQLEEARPLCFIPHVLDGDEWTPWCPGQDHPQYEKFRLLELRHFGTEYADQKAVLEKWTQKKGIDVFVATFSAADKGENGQTVSFCVWSKGVATWLPKTDFIPSYSSASWRVGWTVRRLADKTDAHGGVNGCKEASPHG